MAIVLTERPDSRTVNYGMTNAVQVMRYNFRATEGETEVGVVNGVLSATGETLNGLIRRDVRTEYLEGRTDRGTAEVEYAATGREGTADALGAAETSPALTAPSQAGTEGDTASTGHMGPGYSFEISAETVHITHSRRQMGRVAPGVDLGSGTVTLTGTANVVLSDSWAPGDADVGKVIWIAAPPAGWYAGGYKILAHAGSGVWTLDRAPARDTATGAAAWVEKETADDHAGAIGVTRDEIKGCDVFAPRFTWTRTITAFRLSRAQVLIWRGLVGKKNDRPWYGSAAGEVLYMGCTGTFSNTERWSITHRFAEIANETDIAIIPGELTIPAKRGWDYLWVDYEETNSADGTRVLTRPRGAYIEEVYPDGDFELIGIGR
jgi:hypothetical protein